MTTKQRRTATSRFRKALDREQVKRDKLIVIRAVTLYTYEHGNIRGGKIADENLLVRTVKRILGIKESVILETIDTLRLIGLIPGDFTNKIQFSSLSSFVPEASLR